MKYNNYKKLIVFDQPNGQHNRDISIKEIYNRSKYVPIKSRKIWLKTQKRIWCKNKVGKILSFFNVFRVNSKNVERKIGKYFVSGKKFILTTRIMRKDYVLFESRLSESLGKTSKRSDTRSSKSVNRVIFLGGG